MRDLIVGDVIIVSGVKVEIAEIKYQEPWQWRNAYYIEFIDTKGNYRSWKQNIDGGTVKYKK